MKRTSADNAIGAWRIGCGMVATTLAMVATAGCKQAANEFDATVQGAVTIDGELAPGGTVTFHPVKEGPAASGRIHEDGSYSIRTGQGNLNDPDGGTIRSGEYIATVTVTAPAAKSAAVAEGGPPSVGARLMADKYAMRESSDLKKTVKPGPNVIDLALDGVWANPPAEEETEEGEADAEEGEATDQGATEEGDPEEGAAAEGSEDASGVEASAEVEEESAAGAQGDQSAEEQP
jgi:hypothetical protein